MVSQSFNAEQLQKLGFTQNEDGEWVVSENKLSELAKQAETREITAKRNKARQAALSTLKDRYPAEFREEYESECTKEGVSPGNIRV